MIIHFTRQRGHRRVKKPIEYAYANGGRCITSYFHYSTYNHKKIRKGSAPEQVRSTRSVE